MKNYDVRALILRKPWLGSQNTITRSQNKWPEQKLPRCRKSRPKRKRPTQKVMKASMFKSVIKGNHRSELLIASSA